MLREILRVIVDEELVTNRELAKKLGVQIETLHDMLQMLVNKGYLRSNTCNIQEQGTCSSCPQRRGCAEMTTMQGASFSVTEKGLKWIRRAQ
ncbi:MAG: hypothetical protein BAJATHORv1_40163 [Candidatus Thorarchaeota archaeon]|nr:MAG: hypothetical protein BAJATHORv1_40163 [Candidatus Thorarchaeota archaeon]